MNLQGKIREKKFFLMDKGKKKEEDENMNGKLSALNYFYISLYIH